MLTWPEFTAARPDLAEAGRSLLCQFGVGLGFLATVRSDGGPRLHPICPIVTKKGLYAFIIESPKLRDLLRDGRYALHSYPVPENEDAFYLTGSINVIESARARVEVGQEFVMQPGREGPLPHFEGQTLVEFLIESCLLTRTTAHGDLSPLHTVWRAASAG